MHYWQALPTWKPKSRSNTRYVFFSIDESWNIIILFWEIAENNLRIHEQVNQEKNLNKFTILFDYYTRLVVL